MSHIENQKRNHPKKGSQIAVEPIRDLKKIRTISNSLRGHEPAKIGLRNHLLFVLGINNGLRTGDLLRITVGQVRHLNAGESISLVESKTGKKNVLAINKTVHAAMQAYLAIVDPEDSHYLFKSRKGENQPISVHAVNNMIKDWCAAVGVKGNFGAHTLRKTWGYHQRITHGVAWELICKRFNHGSPAVTMRYLGIQDSEVIEILFDNEIG